MAFPAETALAIGRAHWQIENARLCTLNVQIDEDTIRAGKDHAPANTAALLGIARNIRQACDTTKVPVRHRIRTCTWKNDSLVTAISQMR